jgi:hypothetical protein
MASAFLVLFLLLAVFSGFNCSCLLSAFFEKEQEGQRLLFGSSFGFKEALLLHCCLNLAMALQSDLLWLFLSQ